MKIHSPQLLGADVAQGSCAKRSETYIEYVERASQTTDEAIHCKQREMMDSFHHLTAAAKLLRGLNFKLDDCAH